MADLLANAATNLTSPMILFFVLGIIGALVKSDLLIPESITKALSIYLMMAIGFKGGAELSVTGITAATVSAVGATLALGLGHTDCCVRIAAQAGTANGDLPDEDVFDLIHRVSIEYRWIHVEKLQEFDGAMGFTKAQGED